MKIYFETPEYTEKDIRKSTVPGGIVSGQKPDRVKQEDFAMSIDIVP